MQYTLTLLLCALSIWSQAQSYTTWLNGSDQDVATAPRGGLLLAGGGSDNDNAMRWLLEQADGGDVVIIRASGSNGYNSYLFSELGVTVNSVRTIRFNSAAAAQDSFVIQTIRNAEALFIAGGDQYNYYQYWKDTPIADAINYLINEKRITVGGTSAGMAILGQAYYTPPGGSATSAQALTNPFHPNVDIIGTGGDFVLHPLMANVITDTHYDERTRRGRHFTFVARVAAATGQQAYGIACNEGTALAIGEDGIARGFGGFSYFLKSNCQAEPLPENMSAGQPLTWNRGQKAVVVYRLPGTPTGTNSFDLNDWQTGTGGAWFDWHAQNGVFSTLANSDGDCDLMVVSTTEPGTSPAVSLYPNPVQGDRLQMTWTGAPTSQLALFDALGRPVAQWATYPPEGLDMGALPPGVYHLSWQAAGQVGMSRVVKTGR